MGICSVICQCEVPRILYENALLCGVSRALCFTDSNQTSNLGMSGQVKVMLELSMLVKIWFRNLLLFLFCIFMLFLARKFLRYSFFSAILPRMCEQGLGSCKGLSQDMTAVLWNVFIQLLEQLYVLVSQTPACNAWTCSSELRLVEAASHIFPKSFPKRIISWCIVFSGYPQRNGLPMYSGHSFLYNKTCAIK